MRDHPQLPPPPPPPPGLKESTREREKWKQMKRGRALERKAENQRNCFQGGYVLKKNLTSPHLHTILQIKMHRSVFRCDGRVSAWHHSLTVIVSRLCYHTRDDFLETYLQTVCDLGFSARAHSPSWRSYIWKATGVISNGLWLQDKLSSSKASLAADTKVKPAFIHCFFFTQPEICQKNL